MDSTHIKVGAVLAAAALLTAGVTSVAVAALPQAKPRPCYSFCPSATSLLLSTQQVYFGREGDEIFRVAVRPVIAGLPETPTGTVEIKSRNNILCRIRLNHEVARCSLSSRALAPENRLYPIEAFYSGNASFSPSKSPVRWLKVLKLPRHHSVKRVVPKF
jgi:hypothetical protein